MTQPAPDRPPAELLPEQGANPQGANPQGANPQGANPQGSDPSPGALAELDPQGALSSADEMPVVARMVVEIRSDGIKTVARGAFEDYQTGQQVAIETDPLAAAKLAQAFTRSILGSTAGLVFGVNEGLKSTAKALVPDPLRRLKRKLFRQGDPE